MRKYLEYAAAFVIIYSCYPRFMEFGNCSFEIYVGKPRKHGKIVGFKLCLKTLINWA